MLPFLPSSWLSYKQDACNNIVPFQILPATDSTKYHDYDEKMYLAILCDFFLLERLHDSFKVG